MFAKGLRGTQARRHLSTATRCGELLANTFHSLPEWEAFDPAATSDPRAPHTAQWLNHWRRRMRAQTVRRASIPPHYANGAVEDAVKVVTGVIDRLKFSCRNRARMDTLLELGRLRLMKVDSARAYAEDIRAYLLHEGNQRPRRYRTLYGPLGAAQ